jgi:Transposase DDE domain
VISTVDPQARHAHKTSAQRRDGDKAHLAAEPETGLVTECALTTAAAPDGTTGVGLLAGEQPGLEVLGDSAYGGGATRAGLRAAGHLQRFKPLPLASAVPGGFTIHDFGIDRSAGILRCPAGRTAPISSSGRASFARACPSCPRRCTTAKGGRTIRLPRTRTSCAPPAAGRPPAAFSTATGAGGRWWNARWPGWSPMAAGGCPTAGPSATMGGGRSGSPRSTSVGCWHWALLVGTRPGSWPDRDGGSSELACAEPQRFDACTRPSSHHRPIDQPVRIGKLQQAPSEASPRTAEFRTTVIGTPQRVIGHQADFTQGPAVC